MEEQISQCSLATMPRLGGLTKLLGGHQTSVPGDIHMRPGTRADTDEHGTSQAEPARTRANARLEYTLTICLRLVRQNNTHEGAQDTHKTILVRKIMFFYKKTRYRQKSS